MKIKVRYFAFANDPFGALRKGTYVKEVRGTFVSYIGGEFAGSEKRLPELLAEVPARVARSMLPCAFGGRNDIRTEERE